MSSQKFATPLRLRVEWPELGGEALELVLRPNGGW